MSIIQAIILGIVQGITEFLPISSQAHLYLVPYFFGWNYQGLNFDIALHAGTLVAVLVVFGKEYFKYLRALFTGGPERTITWYLILGSIPAVLAGYFLRVQAETVFRRPFIMVLTLLSFGIFLWIADKYPKSQSLETLDWKKTLFIGFSQAIAIIPGVSRSGSTITAGRLSGLDRTSAARFSFLLSGPIVFGAGLVAASDMPQVNAALIFGFLTSAISGALAIKFLLKYLTSRGFGLFVWYRVLLAGIIVLSIIF